MLYNGVSKSYSSLKRCSFVRSLIPFLEMKGIERALRSCILNLRLLFIYHFGLLTMMNMGKVLIESLPKISYRYEFP